MASEYKVYYYTDARGASPVKEFIDSLQPKARVEVLRIFELIESYGIESVIPHTKKLKGSPIWEIRLLGKDSIRIFYVLYEEKNILILHCF